jgi:hypothetical protein
MNWMHCWWCCVVSDYPMRIGEGQCRLGFHQKRQANRFGIGSVIRGMYCNWWISRYIDF